MNKLTMLVIAVAQSTVTTVVALIFLFGLLVGFDFISNIISSLFE